MSPTPVTADLGLFLILIGASAVWLISMLLHTRTIRWRRIASVIKVLHSPIQANAAQQILEPWIGAQRIKAGPHEDPRAKPLRIGFFEPSHCLILLVQTYVDHGNLGSI